MPRDPHEIVTFLLGSQERIRGSRVGREHVPSLPARGAEVDQDPHEKVTLFVRKLRTVNSTSAPTYTGISGGERTCSLSPSSKH